MKIIKENTCDYFEERSFFHWLLVREFLLRSLGPSFLINTKSSYSQWEFKLMFWSYFLVFVGRPRLGFRGHGPGPSIPLDLYDRLAGRHLYDPVRGAIPIRWYETHRCGAVGDRPTNLQFNGEEILKRRPEDNRRPLTQHVQTIN